jgi:Tfp pilus assembly protein PilV
MRSGFTLVETLVALMLFQVGMLAVAATWAVAARDIAIARRTALARDLARNRVETLRSTACLTSSATGGSTVAAGVDERWRIEVAGAGRVIVDSVSFALPAGRRGSVVIRGAALCPRDP